MSVELVPAKCQNCGGHLKVDSSLKTAVCPFCNQPYIVKEAINHYHKTVVVESGRTAEERIKAGEAYLNLQMWPKAKEAFEEAADLAPYLYMGWWGQVRAITYDFSYCEQIGLGKLGPRMDRISFWESHLNRIEKLYNSALIYAPKEKQNSITEQFYNYTAPIEDAVRTGRNRNKKGNELLQSRIDTTTARLKAIERDYNAPYSYKKANRVEIAKSGGFIAFWVFACIGCFIGMIAAKSDFLAFLFILTIVVPIILRISAHILDRRDRRQNSEHGKAREEYKRQIDSYNGKLAELKQAKEELNREETVNEHYMSWLEKKNLDEANKLIKEIEKSINI